MYKLGNANGGQSGGSMWDGTPNENAMPLTNAPAPPQMPRPIANAPAPMPSDALSPMLHEFSPISAPIPAAAPSLANSGGLGGIRMPRSKRFNSDDEEGVNNV